MKPEEPLHEFQSRPTFSTWLGMALLFAFFGLLALVIMEISPRGSTYEEKRAAARFEKLKAMQEETHKALTTYAWVDKNKGIARIPVEEAMKLTVADLAGKKPVAANPIATPAPNPAPAAGATAAPGASPATSPAGTPAPPR